MKSLMECVFTYLHHTGITFKTSQEGIDYIFNNIDEFIERCNITKLNDGIVRYEADRIIKDNPDLINQMKEKPKKAKKIINKLVGIGVKRMNDRCDAKVLKQILMENYERQN